MRLKGALIADVVGSSSLTSVDRQLLDGQLTKCFRLFNREYKAVLTGDFVYSVGDEFEAVFAPPDAAIRPTLLLHCWLASQAGGEGVRIRTALGVGGVSVDASRQSNRQDGPAFHVARRLIGRLHDGQQAIGIICQGSGSLVYLANSALKTACRFLNLLVDSWTKSQWEAAYWRLSGHRSAAIASRLGIAPQNIFKRLKNAHYDLLEETILEIESILRDSDLQAAVLASTSPDP